MMNKMQFAKCLLATALIAVPVFGGAQTEETVVRNATILTVTRGTIDNGSILIRDGKFAEIGTDVTVPSGAEIIDAAGMYVMPGIIDPHSHVAMEGGVNEGSLAVTSMTSVEDILDPDDINIYRALAGGVTTTNVLHGSANPIGGTKSLIKLRWGKDARDLLMKDAVPGIKFAMGENVKRSRSAGRGGSRRYPATRMGTIDVMRQAFTDALEYQKQWNEYETRQTAGEKNLLLPRRDLELEPLVEVLEGRMQVHVHAYRADEILQMIRLAEEFGFKVHTMEHVLEGYKVAKELAEHGTAVFTFSDWWAYKMEAYDAIPYNAALLTEKGVLVAIKSDSQEEARHLNQEAAKCMKWGGLNEEQALALITINPAKALGVDQRLGSIEVGKDADLVIYNKHPLSVYAVAQKTMIDGIVYFDREKDLAMRTEIEKEKKALMEKLKKAEDEEGDKPKGKPTPGSGGGKEVGQ
jgi:imidazolonepropionase-like amidohydrolase